MQTRLGDRAESQFFWKLNVGGDSPRRSWAPTTACRPLTGALADDLGPQRGAEELVRNLDRTFEPIIDDLYAHDGGLIP